MCQALYKILRTQQWWRGQAPLGGMILREGKVATVGAGENIHHDETGYFLDNGENKMEWYDRV